MYTNSYGVRRVKSKANGRNSFPFVMSRVPGFKKYKKPSWVFEATSLNDIFLFVWGSVCQHPHVFARRRRWWTCMYVCMCLCVSECACLRIRWPAISSAPTFISEQVQHWRFLRRRPFFTPFSVAHTFIHSRSSRCIFAFEGKKRELHRICCIRQSGVWVVMVSRGWRRRRTPLSIHLCADIFYTAMAWWGFIRQCIKVV